MNKNTALSQKARNYSFLLLKFRPRSEKEIYQRLKNKKFTPEVIRQTIDFLKDKGFIDDHYFARAWVEARIKKPLGIRRLREELKIKGIDKDIISDIIGQIKENYQETEIVSALIQERLKKLTNIDPLKAKRRTYAYLLRRGFSPDIVIDVLNRLEMR